jgi:putative addiction module component (TIGR02574 family)
VATELIRSLDESEDLDADAAWARELERRVDDIVSGRVNAMNWAKARKRIEAKLRTRQA